MHDSKKANRELTQPQFHRWEQIPLEARYIILTVETPQHL